MIFHALQVVLSDSLLFIWRINWPENECNWPIRMQDAIKPCKLLHGFIASYRIIDTSVIIGGELNAVSSFQTSGTTLWKCVAKATNPSLLCSWGRSCWSQVDRSTNRCKCSPPLMTRWDFITHATLWRSDMHKRVVVLSSLQITPEKIEQMNTLRIITNLCVADVRFKDLSPFSRNEKWLHRM